MFACTELELLKAENNQKYESNNVVDVSIASISCFKANTFT